jgi:hypothetical protein
MAEHDYDNGYRAGMQKMRDLTQAGIDEMEEALFDMVGLFSADNMLLKGTHLPSALYAARAALQTRRIEATQRSTKRNKPMTKLEVAIQALEGIVVDPTWGLEHETYMRCRVALQKLKEENSDVDGDEVEYIRVDIHEARIKKLEDELSHLEEMRPFWAKGYLSDSVAAQTATSALSSIWLYLGVKDQTACMHALEDLKKHKENSRDQSCSAYDRSGWAYD